MVALFVSILLLMFSGMFSTVMLYSIVMVPGAVALTSPKFMVHLFPVWIGVGVGYWTWMFGSMLYVKFDGSRPVGIISLTVRFSVRPIGTLMVILWVDVFPMGLSLRFELSMNVFVIVGAVTCSAMVELPLRLFIPPSPVLSPVPVPGSPGVVLLVPWGPGRLVPLASIVFCMVEENMASSRRSAVNVMFTFCPCSRQSIYAVRLLPVRL